jgi:pimeloyl-ACP methyl ester carboxylesterase
MSSASNIKINGVSAAVHEPAKDEGKLAVLMPGYLDSKDYPHLIALAENLCERGFLAVRFDPTGTWESEGSIDQFGVPQYLADLKSVIDHFYSQKSFDQCIVIGHSMGGMIALLHAESDPRISAVVGIMAPYAFVRPYNKKEKDEASEWSKAGFRNSKRDLPTDPKQTRQYKIPYSLVSESAEYDLLKSANKITVPKLLIAGELDDVVEPNDIKLIYDKCIEPKTYLELKGVDHDYRWKPEQIKIVNKTILDFLSKLH